MPEDGSAGAPAAAPGGATPPARRSRRLLRRLKLIVLFVPLLAVVLVAAWLWLALTFSYSSGDRAGYVQKFSRKGWLCKTWEGELAMVNLPGTAPEIFRFTVRDKTVAASINRQLGERVVLSYDQHEGLPACFGETSYHVTGVRRVQP